MERASDRFLRGVIYLQIALAAFAVLAGFLRFAPRIPPWALVLLIVLDVAFFLVAWRSGWYARVYHRVEAPTWREEFPTEATARITPGGVFEWHPAGEIRAGVRHGLVHRWWDAERGPRYEVKVVFEIPDEVAPDLLLAATKRALRSAKRSLPARGKVRASAAHRDDPGPTGTVSVRLAVQGLGADASWARAAAEAFARAFLETLGRKGHEAELRS